MNIQEATKIATKNLVSMTRKDWKESHRTKILPTNDSFYNASFQIAMGRTLSDIGNLQPMTSWQMIGKL
ncbi:hypothetical protein U090_00966 [Staphylococcus aureus DAR5892]|nr:hypothetical protein U090_00966 [Staphylococcus aureus DAR5892]